MVSITIGIVVGTGIYETPPLVLKNVSGPWQAMAAWTLGGVMSLLGALCLAELAATYPRSGGDYVYLTRAFGPWLGFLFAWFQLTVIRAANIAMMSFVFAEYGTDIFIADESKRFAWQWVLASAALVLSTARPIEDRSDGGHTMPTTRSTAPVLSSRSCCCSCDIAMSAITVTMRSSVFPPAGCAPTSAGC